MDPKPSKSSGSKKQVDSKFDGSAAIAYLVDFLNESSKLTGYRPPPGIKVNEILEGAGGSGHFVTLPAPRGGFTDHQKSVMETYAKTLTYWRKLLLELEWTDSGVTITLKSLPSEEEEAEETKPLSWREKMRGKAYCATRSIGQLLVNQGFMVREPVGVTLVTMDGNYAGFAIMVKYPTSPTEDRAGVTDAYNEWIPMLVDIFARSASLKSEAVQDGPLWTLFFTTNRKYVSAAFENAKTLRLFVPRRKTGIDLVFFTKATYRACRTLSQKYKKDFEIFKKPLPSWGVSGHSLVMKYRKGAVGKIVDDSYMNHVRMTTEKLMKRFHLQASITHVLDSRSLVVTFYSGGTDRWMAGGHYSPSGFAVIEQDKQTAARL